MAHLINNQKPRTRVRGGKENKMSYTKIIITGQILVGNMDEGFDNREATESYAEWLKTEYRAAVDTLCPDASVEIEMSVEDATGYERPTQVFVDDGEGDENDLTADIYTELNYIDDDAYERWCEEEEGGADD